MTDSSLPFAPRWLCTISASLWIFPFTLLSYLFRNTEFAFFLLLCYLFTFLRSFLDISISRSDDYEDFPGWRFAQAVAIVPASSLIHFLFGGLSFHFSPSLFIFLIVFLVWYFFLGQLPLIILHPLSKLCVQTASKIYYSKKIIYKLVSSFLVVSLCCIISIVIFSDAAFEIPSNKPLKNAVTSSVSSFREEPRQGEEVSKTSDTVWISIHGGTKYHRRSNCSGMYDSKETTKEDAIRRGFEPCMKCY